MLSQQNTIQVPPNFQTDFMHRVAASSGTGTLTGHIYSDDLHNRTRFDYSMPGTNATYTVIQFINVQAKTETEYIITKSGSQQNCAKHTFTYVPDTQNCTAFVFQGQKNINGNKVLAFTCNCTFGPQSYDVEWFWLGPYPCVSTGAYIPYEVIIQGTGYYSETDYKNFAIGTGGNDTYYATPSQCSGSKRSVDTAPWHTSVRSHLSYLLNHF